MEKIRGIIYACLSAATFGMIPLFANTAMQEGVNNDTILVYRYMIAAHRIRHIPSVSENRPEDR